MALIAPAALAQSAAPTDVLAPAAYTSATEPVETQLARGEIPRWAARLVTADQQRIARESVRAWTLFAWGTANMVEGAGFALPWLLDPRRADERVANYGAMTAAWGAVNFALAIPWVLRMPRERARASRWTTLRGDEHERAYFELRERLHGDASVFALMCGLDVAYVATGALMWHMGDRPETRNVSLAGMGLSIFVQGLALLAVDGWNWGALRHDLHQLDRAHRPSEEPPSER